MVAACKRVVAKTKSAPNKKSKHDFCHNDKEEASDIDKTKNDSDKENNKDDEAVVQTDDEDEVIKNTFLEKTSVAVSDKTKVTAIIDLLMEDAPVTELPGTLEASIKNVVNTALFWGVKFYKTLKSASRVVGYVFEKIGMGDHSLEKKLFRTKHWNVICKFIASQTAEL